MVTLVAELLASCNTFQTLCGLTAPDTNAIDKLCHGVGGKKCIFLGEFNPERDLSNLPGAFVWHATAEERLASGGADNTLAPAAGQHNVVVIELVDADHYPDDFSQSYLNWSNVVGGTVLDIKSQSDDLATLNASSLILSKWPEFSSRVEEASLARGYWTAQLQLKYGFTGLAGGVLA